MDKTSHLGNKTLVPCCLPTESRLQQLLQINQFKLNQSEAMFVTFPSSSSKRAISPSTSLRQQRVTTKLFVVVSNAISCLYSALKGCTGWRTIKLTLLWRHAGRSGITSLRICGSAGQTYPKKVLREFWSNISF